MNQPICAYSYNTYKKKKTPIFHIKNAAEFHKINQNFNRTVSLASKSYSII